MSDFPGHNRHTMKRTTYGKHSPEYRERRREFQDKIDALRQEYHEKIYAESHYADRSRVKREYRYYRRHIHYGRPIASILMLLFWVALFLFAGFPVWLRATIAVFAALSTASAVMEMLFLLRMDRRIITPLENLERAVREIANGNYDVRVSGPFHPETAALVRTFNAMARSLGESERLKKTYEDNRKDLVANISHDLKTPITSVLGYLDAIGEIGPGDPERIARYLAIIRSNASYMNKLIDDLFLFSRLDLRRLDLSLETVNVRDFFRDLMEEFSLEFAETDVAFAYEDRFPDATGEGAAAAKIDPKLFCRVLRNLFDNARKYGPERGLEIRVAAGIAERGSRFFVTVSDNGPGIAESAMTHLFERFFRVDAERTKNVSSTGLGLAIARELVEAHGGTISANNRETGGLAVTIEIPLGDARP
jgi:signal transduction histidine kinase